MNLTKNSKHARLYRWFYSADDMPQSLCLYFWKLLFAIILFIPAWIITWPAHIIFPLLGDEESDLTGDALLSGAVYVALAALWCVGCFVFCLFNIQLPLNEHINGAILDSGFCGALVIFFALGIFIDYIDDKRIPKKENKEEVNIIYTFIKAKTDKYCPKITWNDEAKR